VFQTSFRSAEIHWLPNEDAILYFVDSIRPLIKQQCPNVSSLEVVGRSPSRKLQALADTEKSIRLTGRVEDIRPFVARGSACIVPLRIGGGTRPKIFEAMAMNKAVISTSVGAEGLAVRSGENILLATRQKVFAESVVSVLRHPNQRQRLGSAARALVHENYSWPRVTEGFARALHDAVISCKPRKVSAN
jgi:glycosyltransferase involved in cell wall biosynthesis